MFEKMASNAGGGESSASQRRREKDLKEARMAGTADPEMDEKTGAMINPHAAACVHTHSEISAAFPPP